MLVPAEGASDVGALGVSAAGGAGIPDAGVTGISAAGCAAEVSAGGAAGGVAGAFTVSSAADCVGGVAGTSACCVSVTEMSVVVPGVITDVSVLALLVPVFSSGIGSNKGAQPASRVINNKTARNARAV